MQVSVCAYSLPVPRCNLQGRTDVYGQCTAVDDHGRPWPCVRLRRNLAQEHGVFVDIGYTVILHCSISKRDVPVPCLLVQGSERLHLALLHAG
jgi:hypothetical protein